METKIKNEDKEQTIASRGEKKKESKERWKTCKLRIEQGVRKINQLVMGLRLILPFGITTRFGFPHFKYFGICLRRFWGSANNG